ncbi:MAG: DEAD/DEAH box helicase, partial [Nitrososphaera sp.]|nr:DEAD/DEAH box helicase [Nitrososphaera sp.]
EGALPDKTQIVYVSPLKALSNDIEKNLQIPLRGIENELKDSSLPEIKLRVLVRTGDTTPSARTKMTKNPPHILVTTPESLYLLLTSESGRRMLSDVHTVIVDEIHALVGNKRGSHLSLSLERLNVLTKKKLIRIGLSATQKPIEIVAKFLIGNSGINESGELNCTIINAGHKRQLDLAIEIPRSPLTAVMSNEVWGEIYERLEELIKEHKTTLIFVNTRRLAERMAHNLSERLGEEIITAHHGSISKERRLDAEKRLKSGALRALLATSSLELGIDIGSVDLVCQMGSPRAISTFLQRVGRSGHTVKGTPKGRLFPLTRDELVEGIAILDAVRKGELDSIVMPEKPLDILAQHIVAEVSCRDYSEEELYALASDAYPYRNLTRKEFDDIINMLSRGYATQKGRRGAYLHHDMVNRRLRARKGARLTALVSGGAIPDNFDYDVILEPTGTFIGTVNEDFAIESVAGDIFLLGNNSWRILGVGSGKVRVEDANGIPPTIPFWFGEAPSRSAELSFAVSRLREQISNRLGLVGARHASPLRRHNEDTEHLLVGAPSWCDTTDDPINDDWKKNALLWLIDEAGIDQAAADEAVTYLGTVKAALGVIPSQETLVMERFFDEAGATHLVIHSPFGSRLNRAWGLALRKRFCRKFNFELQAAATEDSIILSLGATHSFPLEEVYNYLNPKSVRNVLTQALLDSPMFDVRWRWNASRALAVLRRRAGKKVPPAIQRIHSEDLLSLVFPDKLACQENIQGEREIPDHPLVSQTINDCLYEAMDIEELEYLLAKIEANEKELIALDVREPSPLSEQVLNARPYAFLDDAPLEERRTHAVQNRRWLDPTEAKEFGRLDIEAINAVKNEAWPQAGNAEELHDALVLLGFLTVEEGKEGDGWKDYFKGIKTGSPPVPVLSTSASLSVNSVEGLLV